MIPGICVDVLLDIASDQPNFVLLDARISFVQRDFAFTKALDLAAAEHDAAF